MEKKLLDANHIWNFSKVVGVNRVNIDKGSDIVNLQFLDQKLWTALSCPVHGLDLDYKTLELIDTDKDNRIRVPEILEATKWITSIIKNPDDLIKEPRYLPLSAIDTTNPEGEKLLASSKQILINLEKPEVEFITIEDTSDLVKIFAKTKFNGDSIITEETADSTDLKNLINDIISCIGSATDRSGKQGVNQEMIDTFYKSCDEYSNWYSIAEADLKKYLPFGENTENALNSYNSVKAKIEDYFIRCRLAEFDSKSIEVLNLLHTRYETINPKDLSANMDEIATYPLSKIEAHKSLSLDSGINPAWKNAISQFKTLIINPEFNNKNSLSEQDWLKVQTFFDDFSKWKSDKKGAAVEKLGLVKIREIISQNRKLELTELILKDKALESEATSIVSVDKLVRYYCDIYTLIKNYVSFYDFYSPNEKAIFQSGTLYLEQRSCDMCIKVSDMPKHGLMAGLSGMYLIYCECTSKKKNEKMTIVAALTKGDIDNIIVGRNAIFYDRKGEDWDATITKIIENPISIPQAFWSPYRKVAKLIENQIQKMAAAKESQMEANAASKIDATSSKVDTLATPATPATPVTPDSTAQVPAKQPFDMGKFVGIFAAVGLAIGAIGSALASIVSGFVSLTWWKMPLAIIGILLFISGPSMIIAWLKLRKRNLAPILDANGWAINARAIVNIPFGNTLTQSATLPKNAVRNLNDPYAKKKRPLLWFLIFFIVILGVSIFLLWHFGHLKTWGII